jgi:hypothetical protein
MRLAPKGQILCLEEAKMTTTKNQFNAEPLNIQTRTSSCNPNMYSTILACFIVVINVLTLSTIRLEVPNGYRMIVAVYGLLPTFVAWILGQ